MPYPLMLLLALVTTPCASIVTTPCALTAPTPPVTAIRHVILISVDGLHPGALRAPHIDALPGFARLMRGPHTLEARTDHDFTITLPNHVAMLTGLPAREHRWQWNEDPPAIRHGGTIQARAGRYLPSAFDVAHDRGVSTALFAAKTKFWLFQQSYGVGTGGGAKDLVPPDNGAGKLDLVVYAPSGAALIGQCIARLDSAASAGTRTLDFVHLAEPDLAGHATGWDLIPGSAYLSSVVVVDQCIRTLLEHLDRSETLRGSVAIVLTTDHGGGEPLQNHTNADAPCNFTIPLLIWVAADSAALDLYELNRSSRERPRTLENPPPEVFHPPIRNGELGNLGLQLLGLPPIPGSIHNGQGDLEFAIPVEEGPKLPAIPNASRRSVDGTETP